MDNLWQRRTTTSKISLGTSSAGSTKEPKMDLPRSFSSSKRLGGDTSSHGKSNPFNNIAVMANQSMPTPANGGPPSAFGFGTGAFASFGQTKPGPKTPGAGSELGHAAEKADHERAKSRDSLKPKASMSSLRSKSPVAATEHPIKSTWVVWYRPPTFKYSDYEKSTKALASFSTVEEFWTVYSHLKRPSGLPTVSDYHIFRKGIRPVWEDEENKRGGKWILRLKKGVADRYWEDLLLAIVGDQFAEAGEEVCGAVLSVRSGEDVLSIWTRIDGGRNIKIRETVKRLLAFPPDTNIVWKSHDDSIAQRSAIDQARQEKGINGGTHTKRRDTIVEDSAPEKPHRTS